MLWSRKDVCQLHEDGGEFSILEAELDALPNELNALYRHLLMRISRIQTKRVYQLLAMILEWANCRSKFCLLAVTEMENVARNHHFASKINLVSGAKIQDSIGKEAISKRHADRFVEARRLNQGWCKGLVEVKSFSKDDYQDIPPQKHYHYVTFVHRSVIEFLLQAETSVVMAKHISNIGIVEAISQLHLAAFNSLHARLLDQFYWTEVFRDVVCMRITADIEGPPYTYLEQLESALLSAFPPIIEEGTSAFAKIMSWRNLGYANEQYRFVVGGRSAWALASRSTAAYSVTLPLHFAACHGAVDYVQRKLLRNPELLSDSWTASLLFCCLRQCDRQNQDEAKVRSCFSMILRNVALESTDAFAWITLLHWCLSMTRWKNSDVRKKVDGYIILFIQHVRNHNMSLRRNEAQQSSSQQIWRLNKRGRIREAVPSTNPWMDEKRSMLPDKPNDPATSLREQLKQSCLPRQLTHFIEDAAKSTMYTSFDYTGVFGTMHHTTR